MATTLPHAAADAPSLPAGALAPATPDAGPAKPKRAWRRFAGDRRGVAALEFSLLAIPFFLTIFAIVETAFIFLAEATLDQSVERVARTIRTGELQKANTTAADFRKQICAQVSFLLACDRLAIDLKVYNSFAELPPPSAVKDGDVDASGFGYQLAGPQKVTALRVYYKWPVVTDIMRSTLSDMKDGSHLLYSMAAMQTEPY